MKKEPSRGIADLPAQLPTAPDSEAEARGRFFNTGNAFDLHLTPVPNRTFTAEPLLALNPATPTGMIACDNSAELNCPYPATTPLILAYYAKIRAGETLSTDFVASAAVVYVIMGNGITQSAGERIQWRKGDLIVLPGGEAATHVSADTDCVLWIVTNEPQLSFEKLQAPGPGQAPTRLVHFRAEEIIRQIDLLYAVGRDALIPGSALIFSSEQQEETRNILPTFTAAMNSLPRGGMQRSHRHNSVAVSLIVAGDGCFSLIDGERKDWSPWATTVTPPISVHSHHNEGKERALFLIVQDGGLYYYTRAMGFAFTDHPR